MKEEIKVPGMGESISEAVVGSIIKPTGSTVAMDDEILELETDKVNQVLYAPQAGIITINVKLEDVVKIGQVIGFVETDLKEKKPEKESLVKQEEAKTKTPEEKPKETEKPKELLEAVKKENELPVRVTKDVWLKELKEGKELEKPLKATPSIQKELAESAKEKGSRETRTKMSKIRRVIAARLAEVRQSTAMLTTFNEVDMTAVIALREKYKEIFPKKHGVKLGFMSFFVKASVLALQAFPNVNSYIDGDDVLSRHYIDIGIAVGTEKGLMVPVVQGCDQLSFAKIEQSIEAFAKKAREGRISADDLQGGGFTITNGGVYGSLLSTPILNPPQCAILGMHKIMKRAVVVDDQIVIRQMMYLALSYDHRLIDGKEAVSFLIHIKNSLEDPARLVLEV